MRKSGFTLVELLIVVSIIAVLAAVGLSTFTNAQRKARDARRRADLKAIQKAEEDYYLNHGVYCVSDYWFLGKPGGACIEYSYFPNGIPKDPRSGEEYFQTINTANGYEIWADLEMVGGFTHGDTHPWGQDGEQDISTKNLQ